MVDIFTALLGVIWVCVLASAICKILVSPPKIWDDDNWGPAEIETSVNYDELRKERPHIWME